MEKKLGKLIADVWEDSALEDRLREDPRGVLTEYGVPWPAGREVVVLFATDDMTYVVLPAVTEARDTVTPIGPSPQPPGQDPLALVIAARAARDAPFRDLLLGDVRSALGELGLSVPESHEVRVVENTDARVHLVIPTPPKIELTQEDMDRIAAGGNTCSVTFQSTLEATTLETSEVAVEETTAVSTAETTAEAVAEAVAFVCAT